MAVGQRVGQRGVGCAKQPQQHRRGRVEGRRQYRGKEQQHGEAVADDLLGFLLVALPQRDGRAGRAARADEHGKGVQQHQDGGKQPHARQRRRADALNVADVDAVHDVV